LLSLPYCCSKMWVKRTREARCNEMLSSSRLFKAAVCAQHFGDSLHCLGADHTWRLHCIASSRKPHIVWRWMNILGYFIQELKQLTLALNKYRSAICLFILRMPLNWSQYVWATVRLRRDVQAVLHVGIVPRDCATKKILRYRVFKMIMTGLSFCGQRNWTSQ
jgi:hypothetical protein